MHNFEISRSESNAIKGILIILIILGHFQPYIMIPKYVRAYIYAFHVNCFFILPLLYPIKQLSYGRVKNYFARLMVPYINIFILFFCCSFVWRITHPLLSEQNVMYILGGTYSFVVGGFYPLLHNIGIRYIWFMPLMFSFSIIKDYYFINASKRMKYAILVIGFVSYCVLWVCLKGPYCSELRETVMYISPLSIWQAVGALFMGVITIFVLQRQLCNVTYLISFVILFVLFGITPDDSLFLLALKFIIPIVAFAVLYYNRSLLSLSSLLRKFGERSFEIYIVQTPICVVMYTLLPKLIPNDSIIVRLLSFVLVLTICYYMAKIMSNIKIVKRFFFPRTWDELMGRSR